MSRRTAHLDHRHLKSYGSVLGARPESLDLEDDYVMDKTLTQSKKKKLWRKKIRLDDQNQESPSRIDQRRVG